MRAEGQIDYIEIPTTDLVKTSEFFGEFFGWSFQEWGPDYSGFNDGRMDGGLRRAEVAMPPETGAQNLLSGRAQNNNNQLEQG